MAHRWGAEPIAEPRRGSRRVKGRRATEERALDVQAGLSRLRERGGDMVSDNGRQARLTEGGDGVPTIEHLLGYGQQRKSNGRMAFYGKCSCGMRWPARGKLNHVISDLRAHSGQVVRQARVNGWEMHRGEGLAVAVEIPDTLEENAPEMPSRIAQVG